MVESIVTVSLAGLVAGFIFAIPIAGPVSIMVTSGALRGDLRYSVLLSIGAAAVDLALVFFSVYGISKLYSYYSPAVPYLFVAGSVFLIWTGIRIIREPIDIGNIEDRSRKIEVVSARQKGAFYTGFMINFLNPTIYVGAVTSSFFVISFLAASGLPTGGLAEQMKGHLEEIKTLENGNNRGTLSIEEFENMLSPDKKKVSHAVKIYPKGFQTFASFSYALCLSLGSVLWFYLLASVLVRFRKRLNIRFLSIVIRGLAVILIILGLFFGYHAAGIFLS